MAELSQSEKNFLAERQKEKEELLAKIQPAQSQIEVISEEINKLQVSLDEVFTKQKELGAKKQEIIKSSDIMDLKKQLGEVSNDITKLLQKSRK